MPKGHQCGLNGFTESLSGCFLSGPGGDPFWGDMIISYIGSFVFGMDYTTMELLKAYRIFYYP